MDGCIGDEKSSENDEGNIFSKEIGEIVRKKNEDQVEDSETQGNPQDSSDDEQSESSGPETEEVGEDVEQDSQILQDQKPLTVLSAEIVEVREDSSQESGSNDSEGKQDEGDNQGKESEQDAEPGPDDSGIHLTALEDTDQSKDDDPPSSIGSFDASQIIAEVRVTR